MTLHRPGPFTFVLVVFLFAVGYLSVAPFLGLPFWRLDLSTDFGAAEFLALSIGGVALEALRCGSAGKG